MYAVSNLCFLTNSDERCWGRGFSRKSGCEEVDGEGRGGWCRAGF